MYLSIKRDFIAGFSVFLIALPLCLGIAFASNFPPISGVISAIVGGIFASFFGGAKLSIKGPAAGLIVITLSAVNQLGAGDLQLGYERTLAVGMIAAIIQILFAVGKKANIAKLMPASVVHGMLAAIGLIIVSQQVYVMMGLTSEVSEPIMLLLRLPKEIMHLNPLIFAFGMLALGISVFWQAINKLEAIPSTVVILLLVIPLSLYFNINTDHSYFLMGQSYPLGSEFLVNLPIHFFDAIRLPDFSMIFDPISLKYIIIFALVGSIESLLTVCAVDSIAPEAAPSDLNKDLLAIGMGNLVSTFLGGLPMISEIVRSKANIDYGATSARANFFHGLFMLIAALLLPNLINLMPLSALAALLVFVGIKLASPVAFFHAYQVGRSHFLIFMTTFLVTLASDLLMGVTSGVLLHCLFHYVTRKNS